MIAIVPVRAGELPTGGAEAVAEAEGAVLLAGEGTEEAAASLAEDTGGDLVTIRLLELVGYGPHRFAEVLSPLVRGDEVVILPASADGRDLAPRLADRLGRPLLAGALAIRRNGADLVRWQGSQVVTYELDGPFVATLLPGSRPARSGSQPAGPPPVPEVLNVEDAPGQAEWRDPELIAVVEADPAAVDLSEAARIFAGGAGLGGEDEFRLLERVAARLGASVGGTRVVTDAGLLPHDRQIGTTGVSVSPRCYLALGVSGAAQHVGGVRMPGHVISVNLDASCPMMAMADLALVADAKAFLEALAERVGVTTRV